MAKDIKFNVKLIIAGQKHLIEASADAKDFARNLAEAKSSSDKLGDLW